MFIRIGFVRLCWRWLCHTRHRVCLCPQRDQFDTDFKWKWNRATVHQNKYQGILFLFELGFVCLYWRWLARSHTPPSLSVSTKGPIRRGLLILLNGTNDRCPIDPIDDLSHQNEYQGILCLFELDLYSFIQKGSRLSARGNSTASSSRYELDFCTMCMAL